MYIIIPNICPLSSCLSNFFTIYKKEYILYNIYNSHKKQKGELINIMEQDTYLKNDEKKDCNGCGSCALICPVNAIQMLEDEEGFLYPKIDERKCIKCNRCIKVCSNLVKKISTILRHMLLKIKVK